MAETKVYPKGIVTFKKHEKAPEFVKGSMMINIDEFMDYVNGEGEQYLSEYKGKRQLKCKLLEWEGKINVEIDTYKKA